MAEQIGVIVKAGEEMKADQSGTVFKMGVDKFTYSLFDTKLQAIAKENLGKRVKVTYNQSADGKYRNVESIELAKASEASTPDQPKQWYGKPPEEIASIEAQVAAKIVAELWIADKLPDESSLVVGLKAWAASKLRFDVKVELVRKALDKPLDIAVKGAEEQAASGEELDMSPVKNRGDLFTRCKKYFALSKSQALDKMGGIWEVELEDLDMAWQQVCEQMRKLADEKETKKEEG